MLKVFAEDLVTIRDTHAEMKDDLRPSYRVKGEPNIKFETCSSLFIFYVFLFLNLHTSFLSPLSLFIAVILL